MKILDLIGEHNILPSQHFPKPVLIGGQDVGHINLKNGTTADVYQKDDPASIFLIAHQGNQILGFLGLMHISSRKNMVMAKNAQSYLQGENIFLNLLMFARHRLGLRIISDYEMSPDGETALLKLVNRPALGWKIYNFDQDQTYSLTDPGAVKPENDSNVNPEMIQWYYLLEGSQRFPMHNSTLLSQYYYSSEE